MNSDNILMKAKNLGICKELKGNIDIALIFVSEPGSYWSEDDIKRFRVESGNITYYLVKQAARYGVWLEFHIDIEKLMTAKVCEVENRKELCRLFALKHGYATMKEYHEGSAGRISGHQKVYAFAFKKLGRAFAMNDRVGYASGNCAEYLFLYNGKCDFMLHEMLHLFGAADLYMPNALCRAALKVFPNSVMLSSEQKEIDDLTAYLIGWTKQPSPKALELLRVGDGLTEEAINEALDKEWDSDFAVIERRTYTYSGPVKRGFFNGVGTIRYRNGCYYVGDFLNGMRHGVGRELYIEGNEYVGEFAYNKRCGKGKMTYSDGKVYFGGFAENYLHGKGVLRYPNGTVYEGDFCEGEIRGKGVMRYANGVVYEGNFAEWMPNGTGKMIYPNGAVYEGDFADGEPNGVGKMVYADGSVYEGGFADGERSGTGKMVYPNGDVYVGDYVDGKYHGRGKLVLKDGSVTCGRFENHRYVGR